MLRDNIARIRREPSLLAFELAWRWTFGAVALGLLAFAFVRLQHAIVINPDEELQLQSLSPELVVQALAVIASRALPIMMKLARGIVPALLLLWIVAASVGRAVIISRLVGQERSQLRWRGFIGIHAIRALTIVGLAAGYVGSSFLAALLLDPENPNLLLYLTVFLVLTALVLAVWLWVHWVVSLAAIYPVSEGKGTLAALNSALKLVRSRGRELAGIASANGTARTAIGLVFTLIGLAPLPLYRAAPGLLTVIEVVIALAYCVVSDWLLLARLAGYVEVTVSQDSSPLHPQA